MNYLSDMPSELRDSMDNTTVMEASILTRLQAIETKLDMILSIKPIIEEAMANIQGSPVFNMLSKMGAKKKSE